MTRRSGVTLKPHFYSARTSFESAAHYLLLVFLLKNYPAFQQMFAGLQGGIDPDLFPPMVAVQKPDLQFPGAAELTWDHHLPWHPSKADPDLKIGPQVCR